MYHTNLAIEAVNNLEEHRDCLTIGQYHIIKDMINKMDKNIHFNFPDKEQSKKDLKLIIAYEKDNFILLSNILKD